LPALSAFVERIRGRVELISAEWLFFPHITHKHTDVQQTDIGWDYECRRQTDRQRNTQHCTVYTRVQ